MLEKFVMTISLYESFILRQIENFHSIQNGLLKVADVGRMKIKTDTFLIVEEFISAEKLKLKFCVLSRISLEILPARNSKLKYLVKFGASRNCSKTFSSVRQVPFEIFIGGNCSAHRGQKYKKSFKYH